MAEGAIKCKSAESAESANWHSIVRLACLDSVYYRFWTQNQAHLGLNLSGRDDQTPPQLERLAL